MKSENIYIVWAHPRIDSLTAQVVNAMQDEAKAQNINVTTLDLYRKNFDPVLRFEDEPDWLNPKKQYSPEIHSLFNELDGKDSVIFVFPIWWYSFPAMLKGYLDRVWNYGLAYGENNQLHIQKLRWVALVGGSQEGFVKYGWEKNMSDYVNHGASYLGLEDAKIDFLYNTIGFEETITDSAKHYQALLDQARDVVSDLAK